MNELSCACEIHQDECYVLLMRNYPGRVCVIESGESISVKNVDTGAQVNHVDRSQLYHLPSEIAQFHAAAVPIRIDIANFGSNRGTMIKVLIIGWNETFKAYDAKFLGEIRVGISSESSVMTHISNFRMMRGNKARPEWSIPLAFLLSTKPT